MNSPHERLASVSLDLDDKWTYMKIRGIAGWEDFPSYLDLVIPRVLRFLDERSLRITFFLVGQDAALPRNALVLGSIAEAGHEIGNHSFHHEPWLHLYSKSEVEAEITRAEQEIGHITGRKVRGFRGPGYSVSATVAAVLASRGYLYDASTLPTFLGPLARLYYLLSVKLNPAERKRRARLFGSWRDGLRPLKPYRWETPCGLLTEIPVSTMPVFRVPFHLSYLIWLSTYSELLARSYLRLTLALCDICRVEPSFLLHPLDFLDAAEAPELSFFPGMNVPVKRKLELAHFALDGIAQRYRITTMEEHATKTHQEFAANASIPTPPGQGRDFARTGRCAYVIPVFQAQEDFDETMTSIASSATPCTVFAVDDGSKPPLEIREYGPRVPVHLIRLPRNQGIVAALNAGLDAAIAAGFEYIARIDAGDFASTDRLEKQSAYLDGHPRCMLAGSDAEVCNENGTYCFTIQPPRSPASLAKALHERVWLLHPGVMYRAAVFSEIGLYTNEYPCAEDYEMFLRIARKHEIGVVPESLLTYVLREKSISIRRARTQAFSRLRIQLRYFQWTNWMSYYGALLTSGTLLMPRWAKSAFKMKFLYSRDPSRCGPAGKAVEIGLRTRV